MAWIGMIDVTTQVLKPIAFSGDADDYLNHAGVDLRDPVRANGPSAHCFRNGTHAVCNDIEHESNDQSWKDNALRRGFRSLAAFPLKIDGHVIGAFSLYASELAFFDDDETKLLDEMAMDISFALEVNRLESARRELEDQLRQSQKMEAIGQLTGGIAHDFNNLLTVILGCSEAMGEEVKENLRLRKITDMILGAAQRGAELTHRMLAFARRQTLQPNSVNVNHLVQNLEGLLRHTLKEAIELDVHQGGELWEATVDPAQLENALLNLCVNSQDAMPNGGKLTIETSNTFLDSDYAAQNADVKPGQYVLISVSDTGTGIAPEIIGRVFDPFFTTKEVGKGTGLGLSMVYGFTKQSQGHLKIYSEQGIGTTVKIFLPKADRISGHAEELPPIATEVRGTEVILLVEDDDLVREFAISQLAGLGYRVLEAANGKDAVKLIMEHEEIDLLFTDVVMPGGMNGRELAHAAHRLRPTLRVLYTSGYAESAIVHQGLLDKDVQLLSKPYSRMVLAGKIRETLAHR
jgi:signal transduction histidine kinase